MSESEFGRGYATCLIQFTFHGPTLLGQEARYALMAKKHPDLFSPRAAAEIWASGASDHLYELERPESGIDLLEWAAAERIQNRALDIGHGFRDSSRSTPDECRRLLADAAGLLANIGVTTLDAALTWDADHGLTPEAGTWSCAEPKAAA